MGINSFPYQRERSGKYDRWSSGTCKSETSGSSNQALGTCERRMGLFLYGLGHRSRGCRVCPPAELSIAEHVQQLFPGSLSQPVQQYARISWRSSVLRERAGLIGQLPAAFETLPRITCTSCTEWLHCRYVNGPVEFMAQPARSKAAAERAAALSLAVPCSADATGKPLCRYETWRLRDFANDYDF